MKYRALDPLGDYTVGKPFLSNTPATVGQAVLTRLRLWRGEWFLDTADGTPYSEDVLGKRTVRNPEVAIRQRILGTPGVTAITAFASSYDGNTRRLTVSASIDTLYGAVTLSEAL